MEPRWCLVVLALSALHIGPLLARSVPYGDLMTVGEGYSTTVSRIVVSDLKDSNTTLVTTPFWAKG